MINLKTSESPFKFYCQKVIPLAYDESMSYYEVLCGLRAYIGTLIENINLTSDAVTELQNLYQELVNYVDNYFKNLDVQEEINNKLDEMAESGQLASIIAQFIRMNAIISFNTIQDLKNGDMFVDGTTAKTCGKLRYNDGFGAFYKIRPITSYDEPDEENLVTLTNFPDLVAEKLIDETLTETINSLDSRIQLNSQEINTLSNDAIINMYKVVTSFYYVVDGVNGDDETGNGTLEFPFKTMNKIFDLVNKGHTDIRVNIITSGVYEISDFNALTNFSIHIVSDLTDSNRPVLEFARTNKSIAWYNCHVALDNVVVRVPEITEYRMYFEGCSIGFTNVDTTGIDRICFNGCDVQVVNLTTRRLEIEQSCGYINGLTITNTDVNRVAIRMRHCGGFRLYGTLSVANLDNTASLTDSILLQIVFCGGISVQFNTDGNELARKYYYTSWIENSTCFITRSRENIYNSTLGLNHYYNNAQIVRDNLEDSGWINLTIDSGSGQGAPYRPRYRKLNNVVYVEGVVSNVNQGDIIATLPAGFRPTNRITTLSSSDTIGAFISLRVNEDGQIAVHRLSGTTSVILDSLIFPAN